MSADANAPGSAVGAGPDHGERFGGVGRLLGRDALPRLAAAHVCVVGVGGVGSWTVEGLARSGVGALTLIDLDDVCVTNVNRQLPALDGQIGRPKVAVLADRVRLINPACRVTAITEFFTDATAERLLTPASLSSASSTAVGGGPAGGGAADGGAAAFDCVVDAIDRVANKALLIAACRARGIPCVCVGGAGGRRDATQLRVADLAESGGDALLRELRKTLRRDHGFATGPAGGGRAGARDVPAYGVRCVFSAEPPVFPWADGTCRTEVETGSHLRLDCASGFGTAVWVTGAFGLAAAGEAVRLIVERA